MVFATPKDPASKCAVGSTQHGRDGQYVYICVARPDGKHAWKNTKMLVSQSHGNPMFGYGQHQLPIVPPPQPAPSANSFGSWLGPPTHFAPSNSFAPPAHVPTRERKAAPVRFAPPPPAPSSFALPAARPRASPFFDSGQQQQQQGRSLMTGPPGLWDPKFQCFRSKDGDVIMRDAVSGHWLYV